MPTTGAAVLFPKCRAGYDGEITMRVLAILVLLLAMFGAFMWRAERLRKLEPTLQAATPDTLVFNNDAEPETLDPSLLTGITEMRIVDGLFEGLVNLDPESTEPIPGVAERWEIDPDKVVYTFYLRQNARWSNGKSVVAEDFLKSWQRVLQPETAASYVYQLFPIAGAEDYYTGKIKDFSKVGVQAVDAHTLKVQLRAPCPYFLELAAFPTFFPVPVDLLLEHGDAWTQPGHLVGNGAFVLSEWSPRQQILLRRNPHYWDRHRVGLDLVKVLPYDDALTAYKLYLEGSIHWLPTLPVTRIEEIKQHPDFYLAPYLGTYFYRFNTTRPPFDDPRVRKAFSLAVDREVITRDILKGLAKAARHFCPAMRGYEPVAGLPHDPEAARQLLVQAGYGPGGKAFPAFELMYNTSDQHKAIAEAIAQQWQNVLGVRVSLLNCEWKIYLNNMQSLEFDVCRSSWIGDYPDPNTFFDMFVADGGNNRTGWKNPEYDEWLKRARLETDPVARMKLFQQMERMLVEEELPILPLYIYVNKGLLRPEVEGWFENVRDLHPLKTLRLKK